MRNKSIASFLLFVTVAGLGTVAHAATINTIKNPKTASITISGTTYIPTNYSACANLSLSKLVNGYYYCPKSVGKLTEAQVYEINSLVYKDNPSTGSITVNDTKYVPSDYSACSKYTRALLRSGYYWCRASAGVLSSTTLAQIAALSTPTTAPTPTSYTAQLSWTPPTTRESGAPLTMSELAGYEIYYTSDDLAQSVTVPVSGGSVTTLSVPNLKAGTYHFAISAVDSKGLKSELSSMVSKTLGQ